MKPINLNVICVLVCCALTGFIGLQGTDTKQQISSERKETTYERVMRTGVIRCAYISWKPYSLKDPNHPELTPQGSSIDIIEAVAKRLNLKIEYTEEIGWGNIGEGFATNRYDAVCTQMWPDAPKMKNLSLSIPIFFSEISAFAKTGDMRFKKREDLNKKIVRIAVIDGALTENLAKETFPNSSLIGVSTMASSAEYYMTLTTGKADILLSDMDEITSQKKTG